MQLSTLQFPSIDPIAFAIGPLKVHWYGISYIAGLLFVIYVSKLLIRKNTQTNITSAILDDLIVWLMLGITVGGRLGYVLLYNPSHFLQHPLEAFMPWRGGMAFHGGFLGALAAMLYVTRRKKIKFFELTDLVAVSTPIALMFGRIANFINAEHYGRITDFKWGMVFPNAGPLPRHASQLYEAGLEGLVLFFLMIIAWQNNEWRNRTGMISGIFCIGYALARFIAEYFREIEIIIIQDPFEITIGQLLSLPMIVLGIYLIAVFSKQNEPIR